MLSNEKRTPIWMILVMGLGAMLVGIAVFPWARLGDSGCFGLGGAMPGGDCNVEALWQKRVGGSKLLHVMFIPRGNHRAMAGSGAYGGIPLSPGIHSMPEGLFIDGNRVGPSADVRVFVLRKDETAEGIPLTQEELRLFAPNVINNLAASDVWKEKIGPIVQRETSDK